MISLLLNSALFSQELNNPINLSEIKEEIKALTSDSLIDNFWKQLYASDQDLSNLGNPVIHTKNWVKALAFYDHFAYSSTKYFDTTKTKGHDYLWMSLTLWMHSPLINLNRMTYKNMVGINEISQSSDWSYLNQSIDSYWEKGDTISCLNDESFDLEELTRQANQFIKFVEGENVCLGKWKVKDGCTDLYRSKEGDYYISYGKYIQLDCRNDKFYFPYGTKYLFINKNQELVLVNEEKGEEEVYLPIPTLPRE